MKISIPIVNEQDGTSAIDVLDTDVIDSTPVYDATEHLSTYPAGIEYQKFNTIYLNTGDTIPIKDWELGAEGTYVDGEIIYKDGINTIYSYRTGTTPKQPEDYIAPQSTGFDPATWTSRYSKLATPPVGFVNRAGGAIYPDTAYLHVLEVSSDGTRFVGIDVDTKIMISGTLSTPYDTSTAKTLATATVEPFAVGSYSMNISGNRMLTMDASPSYIAAYMGSYTLPTPWVCTGVARNGVKNIAGFGSVAGISTYKPKAFLYNNTGTRVYVYWENSTPSDPARPPYIQQWNLTTAWDMDSASYALEVQWGVTIVPSGNYTYVKKLTWDDSGTKLLAVTTGAPTQIQHFSVAVAYNLITTKTLIGIKETNIWTYDCNFNSARTKLYAHCSDQVRAYSLLQTNNISTSLWDMNYFDYIVIGSTYITQHKIYKSGSTTYSYTNIYNTNKVRLFQRYTTDNTYYLSLDSNSIEKKAIYDSWSGTNMYMHMKTLIWRPTGIYVRTNLSIDGEFDTFNYHHYEPITSPSDMPQFVPLGATNTYRPFDGKNYTLATTTSGTMSYTLAGLKAFDTVALGNVIGDHIQIYFDGEATPSIDMDINTDRDTHGHLPPWNTTLIYYAPNGVVLDANSSVRIVITGAYIQLGSLMLGISAEAGFTNLELKNDYKDFSVLGYDEWGNIDYTERAKVARYSGSVDMRIENYDMTDRLMISLGRSLVIVNGSDLGSDQADSTSIFGATQKIGRFTSFSQRTVIKDDDLDVMATYSFTLEEIV